MTFKLRVRGDGEGMSSIPSYSQESDSKQWSGINTEMPTTKPKEFTISPNSGTIRAQGFTAIKVKCAAVSTHSQTPTTFQIATDMSPRGFCPRTVIGNAVGKPHAKLGHVGTKPLRSQNQMQIGWAKKFTLLRLPESLRLETVFSQF